MTTKNKNETKNDSETSRTKTFYEKAEKGTTGDGLDVNVTIDDDFIERTKTNRRPDFGQFAKLPDE